MTASAKSRSEEFAEALRRRIRSGALPVGSKLPSEQAMALETGVSRTVVREAVARLQSDGLVETRKGAAARVRTPRLDMDGALPIPLSVGSLLGFLEVRRSIEADMAALAAERRTELQCQEIAGALRSIDEATRRGETGVEQDLGFHLAIGRATSNAYWPGFVRLFASPIRLAIGVTRANEARRRDFAGAVADEHRLIFQAILERRSEAARAAVWRHLTNAADRVLHADQSFWEHEGGDLAQAWRRRALPDDHEAD